MHKAILDWQASYPAGKDTQSKMDELSVGGDLLNEIEFVPVGGEDR